MAGHHRQDPEGLRLHAHLHRRPRKEWKRGILQKFEFARTWSPAKPRLFVYWLIYKLSFKKRELDVIEMIYFTY